MTARPAGRGGRGTRDLSPSLGSVRGRAPLVRGVPRIGRMAKKKGSEGEAAPPAPEALRVAVADSHTHLDMQGGTVAAALAKAASVGVKTLIQVGCDLAGSRWAARTAEEYDNV